MRLTFTQRNILADLEAGRAPAGQRPGTTFPGLAMSRDALMRRRLMTRAGGITPAGVAAIVASRSAADQVLEAVQ